MTDLLYKPPTQPRVGKLLLGLLSGTLVCLLIAYAILMAQWPMMREAHYLHYIAYLCDVQGFAPYRDVFETSWPGTFLFHIGLGKVFGYSALGFRIADFIFLGLLMGVSWRVLSLLDPWMATVAVLSFALAYLHFGPANTLQRDYILLLPVMLAVWLALQQQWSLATRAIGTGAAFAIAASIKPHAVIGLLPMFLLLRTHTTRTSPSHLLTLSLVAAGAACVFAAVLSWLWYRGGLAAFVEMNRHDLPLYQDLNGAHEMKQPAQHLRDTLKWWKNFTWTWPYPAGIAVIRAWFIYPAGSLQRQLVLTFAGLMLCYNLYPLPAGKFWDYHWIPYTFFSILTISLLLIPAAGKQWWQQSFSLVLLLYFLQSINSQYWPWFRLQEQIKNYPDITIRTQSSDEITDFLRQHLAPGDTVQTIDQGGPSTEWLLRANAVLATPYVGSFVFLHHISNPHVQARQQQFIDQLRAHPPKLMIVMSDFTKPSGADTRSDVPGLKAILDEAYSPIRETPSYAIWQRKPDITALPEYRLAPVQVHHSAEGSPQ